MCIAGNEDSYRALVTLSYFSMLTGHCGTLSVCLYVGAALLFFILVLLLLHSCPANLPPVSAVSSISAHF